MIEFPKPPRTYGNLQCTVNSRRALKTVATEIVDSSTRVAICICSKTAVSGSLEGCLKILNQKHKKS